MSSTPLTVFIYEEEATLISNWTLDYPDIETGGDLFGLWRSENEIVVQAVLGPGKNCRRNATSFFQDEHYLSNVGGFLTANEGLCNIGGWHSHHTLNLPEPSAGDAATIWRHLPTPGRFLLVITTIETNRDVPKVSMTFSLFDSSDQGNRRLRMNCRILEGSSPLRANSAVTDILRSGEEQRPSKAKSRKKHPNRNVRSMCEGGRLYYSQKKSYPSAGHRKSYNSQRNKTDRHYLVVENKGGGREHVSLVHNHPPGPCNVVLGQRYATKMHEHDHRRGNEHRQLTVYQVRDYRDENCCTIL